MKHGKLTLMAARVAVGVALLAALQVAVMTRAINPLFVAEPTAAIAGAWDGLVNGTLTGPLGTTVREVAIAFAVAGLAGLVLGYLMWRYGALGRAWEPGVAALFAAPLILLYPIPMVIFGRDSTAIIVQAAVMAVLPVILYTRQGFAAIPSQLLKVAAVYRLTRWQALRHVFLPAAGPTLVTGLRLGLTYILVGVISVEYLASTGGLGYAISFAYLQFNMPQVYAGVVLVVLLAAVLLGLVGRLQRLVSR
jgi:ABC-type nitrate/sulfonate/bicarbonate transport system permease component